MNFTLEKFYVLNVFKRKNPSYFQRKGTKTH